MQRLTVFQGTRRIAQGELGDVVAALQMAEAAGASTLVLDDATGRAVDLDLRGSPADVMARHAAPAPAPEPPRGRGRPKLGVTAREVTLLPRHWEWLSRQPGGASAALRRLVESARKTSARSETERQAREVAYQAMLALAGDLPGYEEALRALFKGDMEAFGRHMANWPADIRSYALMLANPQARD